MRKNYCIACEHFMAVVCYLEERYVAVTVGFICPCLCLAFECQMFSISDLCQSLYETSPVRTLWHLCDREKVIVSDSMLVRRVFECVRCLYEHVFSDAILCMWLRSVYAAGQVIVQKHYNTILPRAIRHRNAKTHTIKTTATKTYSHTFIHNTYAHGTRIPPQKHINSYVVTDTISHN